jgi:hypothetical protein
MRCQRVRTLLSLKLKLNGPGIRHRRARAHTAVLSIYPGIHPTEEYYLVIKSSVRRLASTLDVKFTKSLRQHGF